MIPHINQVPTFFYGFTEEEEKAIEKAIGERIYPGLNSHDGWKVVGRCLWEAGINDCTFSSAPNGGVTFHKMHLRP